MELSKRHRALLFEAYLECLRDNTPYDKGWKEEFCEYVCDLEYNDMTHKVYFGKGSMTVSGKLLSERHVYVWDGKNAMFVATLDTKGRICF